MTPLLSTLRKQTRTGIDPEQAISQYSVWIRDSVDRHIWRPAPLKTTNKGPKTSWFSLIEFVRLLQFLTHDPRLREGLIRSGYPLHRTQLDRKKHAT